MTHLKVGPNTRVKLHFSLKFEDGSVIDSTFDKEPANFTVGDGSLLDGFEKKIHGLQSGQQGSFSILPEQGFGQPNPNNVQHYNRKDFSEDIELAEGLMISFADANQAELPGVVKSIEGDRVAVDFNHPLAGHTIQFDVDILNVEKV